LIPWEIWRDNFIQDAPESVARSIWEQLSPEPNQVNLDKLDHSFKGWRYRIATGTAVALTSLHVTPDDRNGSSRTGC
jgi:hypothetical protein